MDSGVSTSFPDSLKVKDALQIYFSLYHFKNGGYNLKWFKIKVGALYLPLPDIKARVDAVKIHDLHHLVTQYKATYRGEAEIGAWEIASGCEKYSVAWLLNLGSVLVGMLFYPRALLQAFLRGRRAATNLYYNTTYNEALLTKTVGELRATIDVDSAKRNTPNDYLLFFLCCLVALVYHAAVLGLLVAVVCKFF